MGQDECELHMRQLGAIVAQHFPIVFFLLEITCTKYKQRSIHTTVVPLVPIFTGLKSFCTPRPTDPVKLIIDNFPI